MCWKAAAARAHTHTHKHRVRERESCSVLLNCWNWLNQIKHSWAVAVIWQFAFSMCAVKFNLLLMLSLCAFKLSHSWPVKNLQEEFRLSWAALNASRWRESPTTASCGPHSLPLIHHPSIAVSILPFAQLSCSSNGVIHYSWLNVRATRILQWKAETYFYKNILI